MNCGQRYCTECGTLLAPEMRFCGQCGKQVQGQVPSGPHSTAPQGSSRGETVTGIVPFIEQGLLSVIHYTLVVTDRRLIFCAWDPASDEEMSDADDEQMQESCSIDETADEIRHFRAKDWKTGPWQRYAAMDPDTISRASVKTLAIPLEEIAGADIVCETRHSTQDTLHLVCGQKNHTFDLMYSQGPYLFTILQPVLGERVRIADPLAGNP